MNLRCDVCPTRDRGVRRCVVTLPGGRRVERALCANDRAEYARAGAFIETYAGVGV